MIATSSDPAALTAQFVALPFVLEVVAHGDTKATVISADGLRFDLRVVPPESYGNLLQHFTGSKDHNVALRERAVKDGLSVSEYSITVVETGEELRYATEEEVYERLGYAWIPPELRENGGELEAARRGELPVLVEQVGREGRPAPALRLVRRARDDRGDGAGGDRARLRLHGDHRPLAAAAGRAPRRATTRRWRV